MVETGGEPKTEAARRIVTNHGDLHGDNILIDKKKCNIWAIDYEFTQPCWAINDIAYMISIQQFGMKKDNYDSKFNFCKAYLQEMGYPTEKKDVDDFIFDAECQRLRVFHPAVLFQDVMAAKGDSEYKLDKYKAFVEFELAAKNDEFLYGEVLKKGITEAGREHSESIKEQMKLEEVRKEKTAPQRMKDQIPNQIKRRRATKQTYEDQLQMEKEAFEKGIVRIEIDEFATWEVAEGIANNLAGGFATKEELKESGVNAGQNNDFWNYAIRQVGEGEEEKLRMDVVQIGNHTSNPERYFSHHEFFGPCGWHNNFNAVCDWRPLNHFYAKRCPVKNTEFKPPTHEKDIQVWVDYLAKIEEEGEEQE